MHILFRSFLLIFITLSFAKANGQTYLFVEEMSEVKAIKIPVGYPISIKTKTIPEWTSYTIERLLDAEEIIIHEDGMIPLTDITHVRIERRWARLLGAYLQRFGVAWALYGTIAWAAQLDGVEPIAIAVGAIVPIGVGYLIKKVWQYKVYKIGRKNRLRILDLSFPDDPYNEKPKVIKP